MFSLRRLLYSFRYAFKGVLYIWKHEQNFRVQILLAALVVLFMLILHVSYAEAIVLTGLIVFVLVLEVLNTIFEKMVDLLKPRIHSYVSIIKDMMAAAVFIASVGSAIIAGMIFIPHIIDLF